MIRYILGLHFVIYLEKKSAILHNTKVNCPCSVLSYVTSKKKIKINLTNEHVISRPSTNRSVKTTLWRLWGDYFLAGALQLVAWQHHGDDKTPESHSTVSVIWMNWPFISALLRRLQIHLIYLFYEWQVYEILLPWIYIPILSQMLLTASLNNSACFCGWYNT